MASSLGLPNAGILHASKFLVQGIRILAESALHIWSRLIVCCRRPDWLFHPVSTRINSVKTMVDPLSRRKNASFTSSPITVGAKMFSTANKNLGCRIISASVSVEAKRPLCKYDFSQKERYIHGHFYRFVVCNWTIDRFRKRFQSTEDNGRWTSGSVSGGECMVARRKLDRSLQGWSFEKMMTLPCTTGT